MANSIEDYYSVLALREYKNEVAGYIKRIEKLEQNIDFIQAEYLKLKMKIE